MSRKLWIYIASSIDGFIAAPGEDLSFLDSIDHGENDYGYADFISKIDTVILGRKTYDWVMTQVEEFPHADKKTYVITRSSKPDIGNISFYNGDLQTLIQRLKSEEGKDIFCDGGAEVIHELLKNQWVDELIISVVPILLGDGVRLFKDGRNLQKVELISSRSFSSGMVQQHWRLAK
ncbi:MAG: dihydrofolate reductase [Bacteroidetes bacterium]|nr:dihydrofolate reductase [Bacteroidota bacterium]